MPNGINSIEELLHPKGHDVTQLTTQEKLQEKMQKIQLGEREAEVKRQALLLDFPYISLEAFPIGPETLSLIPEEQAKELQAICFFKVDAEIRIAVVNPDHPGIHELISQMQRQFTDAHISLYLISMDSFQKGLKLYATLPKTLVQSYGVQITQKDLLRFQEELKSFGDLQERLPKVTMTEAFAMIIALAMTNDASDVHIEAEETDVKVRYRLDGILQQIAVVPKEIWPRLIARIKGLSGLKINVDDIPQDGRITIDMKKEKLDLRISTLPSAYGESVVMRLLTGKAANLQFEQLGLRGRALKELTQQLARPNGMIITTGPTGSGKTTTLYAFLNKLNTSERKIITLEDPIEYRIRGLVQSQIDHSKDYTFAKGLRAILRQDPNVVMVGEIRDLETAEVAIQAALTGHLMFSTIHTNDAAGAIPRFLSMGVKAFLLAPALNAVIGQRLVRRVHDKCKAVVTLDAETQAKAKILLDTVPVNCPEKAMVPPEAEWKFYKGQGCTECNRTGYKGRVGIYEVFTMNPEIEQMILKGDISDYRMREIMHTAGFINMAQDGILKALDGFTSVDEVFRVTA